MEVWVCNQVSSLWIIRWNRIKNVQHPSLCAIKSTLIVMWMRLLHAPSLPFLWYTHDFVLHLNVLWEYRYSQSNEITFHIWVNELLHHHIESLKCTIKCKNHIKNCNLLFNFVSSYAHLWLINNTVHPIRFVQMCVKIISV